MRGRRGEGLALPEVRFDPSYMWPHVVYPPGAFPPSRPNLAMRHLLILVGALVLLILVVMLVPPLFVALLQGR